MGYDDKQLNQIAELATLRLKEYGFIIESRSKTDKVVQAVSPDVVAAVLWAEFNIRYDIRYDIPCITTRMQRYSFKEFFEEFDLLQHTPEELAKQLWERFGTRLEPRSSLSLFEEYSDWVRSGRKVTTIRYRKSKIDYPAAYWLPVKRTSAATGAELGQDGWAHLQKMVVKPFGQLDTGDAVRDGFTSLSELKEALEYIYGKIQDTEYVSVYTFELYEHVH